MFSLFQIEIWIHLFAGSVIFESASKVCHGIKFSFFPLNCVRSVRGWVGNILHILKLNCWFLLGCLLGVPEKDTSF